MFRQFPKCLNLALIPLNCDVPTRHTMGCEARVSHCYWDSLTFSFSVLTPVPVFSFICTISIITKILFTYTFYTPPSGIHYVLYTYTRVPLLILLQNYTYKIRDCGKCGEHLSLRWHALLMWNALSSILVFFFCTYTD